MNILLDTINTLAPYIILGMSVIIILLFIVVIILFKTIGGVQDKYRKLMRGTNAKNLEEMITERMNGIDDAINLSNKVDERCAKLENQLKGCVQKVAIMRYKAFENVGSDLSFSIALLDQKDDGVILTGIYGREESTTYAKPVDKGISRYELSEEENCVLKEAANKQI